MFRLPFKPAQHSIFAFFTLATARMQIRDTRAGLPKPPFTSASAGKADLGAKPHGCMGVAERAGKASTIELVDLLRAAVLINGRLSLVPEVPV